MAVMRTRMRPPKKLGGSPVELAVVGKHGFTAYLIPNGSFRKVAPDSFGEADIVAEFTALLGCFHQCQKFSSGDLSEHKAPDGMILVVGAFRITCPVLLFNMDILS